jgi:hypothetical protein
MKISFNMRGSQPQDTLIQEVEGQSVLINLKSECYFGLDDVGTFMWKTLTTSTSIQAAYEALLAEYDVGSEQLRQDVQDFAEKLIDRGLLEVNGG